MMTRELEFFEYLGSLKHDLFLLQETHIQTEDIEAWSAKWGEGACFWNPGGNKSRGMGIVCNVSLDFEDLEGQERFSWSFDQCKTVLTRLEVSDLVYLCS